MICPRCESMEKECDMRVNRVHIKWNNQNIDMWYLVKAIEDVLPNITGYEKGRLEEAVKHIRSIHSNPLRKPQDYVKTGNG